MPHKSGHIIAPGEATLRCILARCPKSSGKKQSHIFIIPFEFSNIQAHTNAGIFRSRSTGTSLVTGVENPERERERSPNCILCRMYLP